MWPDRKQRSHWPRKVGFASMSHPAPLQRGIPLSLEESWTGQGEEEEEEEEDGAGAGAEEWAGV